MFKPTSPLVRCIDAASAPPEASTRESVNGTLLALPVVPDVESTSTVSCSVRRAVGRAWRASELVGSSSRGDMASGSAVWPSPPTGTKGILAAAAAAAARVAIAPRPDGASRQHTRSRCAADAVALDGANGSSGTAQ